MTWEPGTGIVELPDGRRVRARGLRRPAPPPAPELGVYLVGRPPPPLAWEAQWVRWSDFGLPRDTVRATAVLREAFDRAAIERVELACGGGVGRTGTALALMGTFCGLTPREAVAWVRGSYHRRAVETPWQRRWLERVGRP